MKNMLSVLAICLVLPAAFILQGHTNKGGDHYRIFINDKMVLEKFVYNKSSIPELSLSAVNENDKMVIHYSHCGTVGSSRVVSIRDLEGKNLKTWKFPDSKSSGMQLTIKDVRNFAKGSKISLHYASKELNPGMQLTNLVLNDGKMAKR